MLMTITMSDKIHSTRIPYVSYSNSLMMPLGMRPLAFHFCEFLNLFVEVFIGTP